MLYREALQKTQELHAADSLYTTCVLKLLLQTLVSWPLSNQRKACNIALDWQKEHVTISPGLNYIYVHWVL